MIFGFTRVVYGCRGQLSPAANRNRGRHDGDRDPQGDDDGDFLRRIEACTDVAILRHYASPDAYWVRSDAGCFNFGELVVTGSTGRSYGVDIQPGPAPMKRHEAEARVRHFMDAAAWRLKAIEAEADATVAVEPKPTPAPTPKHQERRPMRVDTRTPINDLRGLLADRA